jgi:hypothetical protein
MNPLQRAQQALRDKKNPNLQYEQLKHAASQARLPYDKDGWLNLAFYLDEQYVEWKDDISSIRTIPRPDGFEHTPRPVANKIMHFVQQEHASVLQADPTVDVLPATDDMVDISIANVALAYLRWLAEPQNANFDRELGAAALWSLIHGEGYLKWVFNSRLERPDVIAVSPFDLYSDPYATDFSKARWVIHTQFMDPEQVFDLYGKEVSPNDIRKADPIKTQLMREMGAAPVLEGVEVNELWLKPCRRHKDGIFAVWSGHERLVEAIPFPYEHKRLPFTQLGQVARPGSQHYSSAVKYLRSPQMELNKYHAQRIMIREAFANPKWFIPTDLELEADPDDSPNQILRGNSMGGTLEPKIIQPGVFPDNQDGEWITNEMMHIVGLHEVSQAQVPGRVEAAKAIELLKESDANRQSTLLDTVRTAISEGFWQTLMLTKQYVPDEVIIQTYSREGMAEVKRFKTEEIKPAMRVIVTSQNGLARSRAARSEQLLRLWDSKIIQDPETMAELLEVPVPTLVSHRAFENLEMAGGTAITPNSWDDHQIHLREHNNYRKTSEYLLLEADRKQKFEYHCQTHEQMQTDQLLKLAQKQQILAMAQQPPSVDPAQTAPNEQSQLGGPTEEAPAAAPA